MARIEMLNFQRSIFNVQLRFAPQKYLRLDH